MLEYSFELSKELGIESSVSKKDTQKTHAEIKSLFEYSPSLIEEAVMRFITGKEEEVSFRKDRNALYDIKDGELRETAFQNFHLSWYAKLKLDTPMVDSLISYPLIISQVDRIVLIQAPSKKKEGAELFRKTDESAPNDEKNTSIILTLTPERFSDSDKMIAYLRHELQHIEDMLNPDFGYKLNSSNPKLSALISSLFLQRYSVLWDLTVDGRLSNKQWETSVPKESHFEKFQQTFQLPQKDSTKLFNYFFDNPVPKHEELEDFAVDPKGWLKDRKDAEEARKGNCSLCTFSSTDLSILPKLFPREILEIIQDENPHWKISDSVCGQCIDIYESRLSVSRSL